MCDTCGCDEPGAVQPHHHGETHTHDVRQPVLDLNQQLAADNKVLFAEKGILCLNLLSSPGSGKTTLLEKLIAKLDGEFKVGVVEGDQQTHFDAARIRKVTSNVTQVNTNRGCHLDAHMVHHAIGKLDIEDLDILFVENVGNLVCPSMFDLGESKKVVILSVTEGDDKPLKYPNAFFESGLAVISKVDLLPYVDFDIDQCEDYIRRVNPGMDVLRFSSKSGDGVPELIAWLRKEVAALKVPAV